MEADLQLRHSSFTERVLPQCIGIVFLAFRDGEIGRGVATEVAWFLERALLPKNPPTAPESRSLSSSRSAACPSRRRSFASGRDTPDSHMNQSERLSKRPFSFTLQASTVGQLARSRSMPKRLLTLVLAGGLAACGASAKTAAPKKAAPPAAAPAPPPKTEPPLVIQDGGNVSFPRYGFSWVTPHKEWKPEIDPDAAVGSGGAQIQMSRDDLLTVIRIHLFEVPQGTATQAAEALKGSVSSAAKVTVGAVETSADGRYAGFTVESTDPQNVFKDRIAVMRPRGASDPLMMIVQMRTFDPSKFDAALADLAALFDSIKPL